MTFVTLFVLSDKHYYGDLLALEHFPTKCKNMYSIAYPQLNRLSNLPSHQNRIVKM